jgi:hypothetical protein
VRQVGFSMRDQREYIAMPLTCRQNVYAGGAVHQVALSTRDQREYVVSFFFRPAAFRAALTLQEHPTLARVLPRVARVCAAPASDPDGAPMPCFLVKERGVSLRTWAKHSRPDFAAAVQARRCSRSVLCTLLLLG